MTNLTELILTHNSFNVNTWAWCINATQSLYVMPQTLLQWLADLANLAELIVRAGSELYYLALTWEIEGLKFLYVQIQLIYSPSVSSKASNVLAWDLWPTFHAWLVWPAWLSQSRSHVCGNVTRCQTYPGLVSLYTLASLHNSLVFVIASQLSKWTVWLPIPSVYARTP